jgi:diguanylate cyclase (GGDEF)-like protein
MVDSKGKAGPPPSRGAAGQIKTVAGTAGPASRSRAVLTISTGPHAGRVLSLRRGEPLSFGRAEDCTFSFADGSLSRMHAIVVWVGGSWVLKDEGSTNGTFVNDQRIAGAKVLNDGDRVQLGLELAMRFSLVTPEEEAALQRVYDAAMRDGLTGVFNRKHTEERLDAELAYAVRHGTPLCVVLLDVDHFKRVNDTHGHPAGDEVLRTVARSLQGTLRTEDVLGRWGGEEFLILVRGAALREGGFMAERLRQALAAEPVRFEEISIPVTASFGVASLDCCGEKRDRATLVSIADARLYQAKQSGRNRVSTG